MTPQPRQEDHVLRMDVPGLGVNFSWDTHKRELYVEDTEHVDHVRLGGLQTAALRGFLRVTEPQ